LIPALANGSAASRRNTSGYLCKVCGKVNKAEMNIREIALFLTWATPTFGSNNCRAQLLWMYRQKLPQMIDYSGEHHEVS